MLVGSSGVAFTFDETVAIILGSFVIALLTWSVGHFTERLNQAASDARETRIALVGEEPNDLNPNPKPGLVAVVSSHSEMLAALVADKKPNGGSTTRDAINRIEESLGTGPSTHGKDG
jgi:hypothetical protein